MRRKWYWMVPLAIIAIPLFIFIGGEVVMRLWNWLLPAIFGWRQITFWQALGILLLARILFGRLGGHGGPPFRRGGFRGRCRNLSPEEREKFRRAMGEGYEVGGAEGRV